MTNKAGVIMTHRVGLKIIMRKCCAEIVTCPQFIELWIKLVLVPFTCKLERTGSNCTMKQYFTIVDRLNIPPGLLTKQEKNFFSRSRQTEGRFNNKEMVLFAQSDIDKLSARRVGSGRECDIYHFFAVCLDNYPLLILFFLAILNNKVAIYEQFRQFLW